MAADTPKQRDEEKMAMLLVSLNALQTRYVFETDEYRSLHINIAVLIGKIITYATENKKTTT